MALPTATAHHFNAYARDHGHLHDYQGGQGFNKETLSGDKDLKRTSAVYQLLDPDGSARDVNLPVASSAKGHVFRIVNQADGAENLVVKDAGGSTVVTVSQNEAATVVCDGSDWEHAGIESISLS